MVSPEVYALYREAIRLRLQDVDFGNDEKNGFWDVDVDGHRFFVKGLPKEAGQHEAHIYTILLDLQGKGISRLYDTFTVCDTVFLVLDRLDRHVEKIDVLDLETVQGMFHLLKQCHIRGVRVGDAKFQNFMFDGQNRLVVIDFDLASCPKRDFYPPQLSLCHQDHWHVRKYLSLPNDFQWAACCGTPRYAGVGPTLGAASSFSSDYESLHLSVLEVWAGGLPWKSLPLKSQGDAKLCLYGSGEATATVWEPPKQVTDQASTFDGQEPRPDVAVGEATGTGGGSEGTSERAPSKTGKKKRGGKVEGETKTISLPQPQFKTIRGVAWEDLRALVRELQRHAYEVEQEAAACDAFSTSFLKILQQMAAVPADSPRDSPFDEAKRARVVVSPPWKAPIAALVSGTTAPQSRVTLPKKLSPPSPVSGAIADSSHQPTLTTPSGGRPKVVQERTAVIPPSASSTGPDPPSSDPASGSPPEVVQERTAVILPSASSTGPDPPSSDPPSGSPPEVVQERTAVIPPSASSTGLDPPSSVPPSGSPPEVVQERTAVIPPSASSTGPDPPSSDPPSAGGHAAVKERSVVLPPSTSLTGLDPWPRVPLPGGLDYLSLADSMQTETPGNSQAAGLSPILTEAPDVHTPTATLSAPKSPREHPWLESPPSPAEANASGTEPVATVNKRESPYMVKVTIHRPGGEAVKQDSREESFRRRELEVTHKVETLAQEELSRLLGLQPGEKQDLRVYTGPIKDESMTPLFRAGRGQAKKFEIDVYGKLWFDPVPRLRKLVEVPGCYGAFFSFSESAAREPRPAQSLVVTNAPQITEAFELFAEVVSSRSPEMGLLKAAQAENTLMLRFRHPLDLFQSGVVVIIVMAGLTDRSLQNLRLRLQENYLRFPFLRVVALQRRFGVISTDALNDMQAEGEQLLALADSSKLVEAAGGLLKEPMPPTENGVPLGALIQNAQEYAHRQSPAQNLVSALITAALKRLEVEPSASPELGITLGSALTACKAKDLRLIRSCLDAAAVLEETGCP